MRDKLIERCIKTIVGDNDRRLVDFAFGKSITQANLDEFLASWDIEVAGADKALLLAYVMRQRADLVFPPYTGPRLRGLINRYRFDNLRLIAHFSRITKVLNAAGVIPLVLKGGAMRAMRPDLPRNMGDIDILVRGREDFAKARETACALGYRLVENSHAIDLHEQGSEAGVLDIHSHLDINPASAGIDVAPLFYGARRMQVFGAEAYVPSAEAMMFVLLQNLSKNLKFKCSMSGVLYSLFDADYLTSSGSDFDWERVWSLTGHFGAGSF